MENTGEYLVLDETVTTGLEGVGAILAETSLDGGREATISEGLVAAGSCGRLDCAAIFEEVEGLLFSAGAFLVSTFLAVESDSSCA